MSDPQIDAALQQMDSAYESAVASKGAGAMVDFPPHGEHDVAVVGVNVRTASYKPKFDGAPKEGFPAIAVQFEYIRFCKEDDSDWDPERPQIQFSGKTAILADENTISKLPDNYEQQQKIAHGRIKGLLECALGREGGKLSSNIKELQAAIASEQTPTMVIFCDQSPNSAGKVYPEEYGRENTSNAEA